MDMDLGEESKKSWPWYAVAVVDDIYGSICTITYKLQYIPAQEIATNATAKDLGAVQYLMKSVVSDRS